MTEVQVDVEHLDPQLSARLERVRTHIAGAATRADRDPAEITLIGACKGQPAERIAAAVRAGLFDLGGNYVQEVAAQRARLVELLGEDSARVRWRLIGHLQSNKAAAAVEIFESVESVDRASIARALEQRAAAADKQLELLIQVNLSGEPQKNGVSAEELPDLLRLCEDFEHVRVAGLMAVPAATSDPEASRPAFAELRDLRDAARRGPGGANLQELSMGMSNDFEVAIEEGATHVRVGTAIFGPRENAR